MSTRKHRPELLSVKYRTRDFDDILQMIRAVSSPVSSFPTDLVLQPHYQLHSKYSQVCKCWLLIGDVKSSVHCCQYVFHKVFADEECSDEAAGRCCIADYVVADEEVERNNLATDCEGHFASSPSQFSSL